jgi:hypothetical protein
MDVFISLVIMKSSLFSSYLVSIVIIDVIWQSCLHSFQENSAFRIGLAGLRKRKLLRDDSNDVSTEERLTFDFTCNQRTQQSKSQCPTKR